MNDAQRERNAWGYLARRNFRKRITQMTNGTHMADSFKELWDQCLEAAKINSKEGIDTADFFAAVLNDFVDFFDQQTVEEQNNPTLVVYEKTRDQMFAMAVACLLSVRQIDINVYSGREKYGLEELSHLSGGEATDDAERQVEEEKGS